MGFIVGVRPLSPSTTTRFCSIVDQRLSLFLLVFLGILFVDHLALSIDNGLLWQCWNHVICALFCQRDSPCLLASALVLAVVSRVVSTIRIRVPEHIILAAAGAVPKAATWSLSLGVSQHLE